MESVESKGKKMELPDLNNASRYRNWWLFQYSNRHFKNSLLRSDELANRVDETFRWLTKVYEWLTSESLLSDDASLSELVKFSSALVYEYHNKTESNKFKDGYHEDLLMERNYPLAYIPPKDTVYVKHLHEITLDYGFLAILLDIRVDHTASWDMFINRLPLQERIENFVQTYSYPKRGDFPKGLQISIEGSEYKPNDDWDLAIYYHHKDTFSHLVKEISSAWGLEGKQVVGCHQGHYIALYVDRSQCKRRYVLDALSTQVRFSLVYDATNDAMSTDARTHEVGLKALGDKRLKNLASIMVDGLKWSEGLREKRKDLDKDNIRRAVGLYLWDILNSSSEEFESKNSLIKDTIEKLEESAPFALDSYRSGYSSAGGRREPYDTVIREMRKDIALTDHCIKHADFFTSNQLKKE